MLENKNEQAGEGCITRGRCCKVYKISPRECGHVEGMQNQRMTKQFATGTMEETWKRGNPRKSWRREVEEDFNIMEIKSR